MSENARKNAPSRAPRTSSIPGMWAVPAEVTAPAVATSRGERGGLWAWALGVALGVALIGGLAVTLLPAREPPRGAAALAAAAVTSEAVTSEAVTSEAVTSEAVTSEAVTPEPARAVPPSSSGPALLVELPARRRARSLTERGKKQLLKSNDKNALLLLDGAVKLDPLFAPAWRDLGVARARLGDTVGARAAYRRYLELAPEALDAPDVRRILGQ